MAGKRLKLLVYGLTVIAIVAALAAYLGRARPIEVITRSVDVGAVQDTIANTRAGTIKACNRAGISPQIGGQIASLPVDVGDTVKAGQILLELWNEDRAAEVTLARSEVKSARARASQACVLADVAARDAERLRTLRKKGLTTEEAADKADGDARAQAAACDAARATAEVSEARLQVAQASLSRTQLRAPFDGIVAEINGEVGEFVTPSPVGIPTPPAVDLVDITCLYASAPIDEVDAPGIRAGMPARISLDAFPRTAFAGTVRRIAPYVLDLEKQARTVDVEVDFADATATGDMLPGYSADIEIILDTRHDVTRVPTEAILEGNRVLLLGADNVLQEREIESGLSNWEHTEVLAGLQPGDRVVVSVDREGVKDGAHVKTEGSAGDNDQP
ncbi:MAG: efflux RND transporter periplasmic adaptor subunit [Thiogranum sp.]|nr:efflux RND transporter periplasmic adaptor subunit [Thiogranum sp.]